VRNEIEGWSLPQVSLSIGAASDRSASKELLQGLTKLGTEYPIRIYIHVAEGLESVVLSIKHRGLRPVEFLDEIGFLRPNVTLIHASNITEEEISRIAVSNASICHCPVSNAKTIAGVMPLKLVREAGIPVCLGTDAASTNNTNNILLEGYSAALIHRAVKNIANFPTAEEIFSMLTVEGAKAVGCEGIIGEVREGFRADLVLWNKKQPAFLPNIDNPVSSLIYCASEIRPTKVYVNGQLIFDKGPLTFSFDEVYEKLFEYGRSLSC
jgi:5-methylthioadenosine/S-adenosylhomocysteine deaminase